MSEIEILNVGRAAEALTVSTQTVRNWIDSGLLPATKIGRNWRIRRDDIDALLARTEGNSATLATRRDVWSPETMGLPHRRRQGPGGETSIWDAEATPTLPRKRE
jgi:excisionase family DNA binding protein